MLRPLVHITPVVARLQGASAIGLAASLIAIGLSSFVPKFLGGALIAVAVAAYLIGAGTFVYATWLSQRSVA